MNSEFYFMSNVLFHGIYIKMIKFLIQEIKFHVEKSSKNEVMNFLRLINFLKFFMIFQDFLEIKMAKKGVYLAQDPCGADEAKIKEKWSSRHGDRGPLIIRYMASS